MNRTIKFEDLVDIHGHVDAMRVLEAVESMMQAKEMAERLEMSPSQRFDKVIAQVVETNFA